MRGKENVDKCVHFITESGGAFATDDGRPRRNRVDSCDFFTLI